MSDTPRDQMKQRFHQEGLTSFRQQELLELLLHYSSHPKKDVTALAKALLERFGCATNVFDASIQDLLSVRGMTSHSAILLKMIPQLSRKYMLTKTPENEFLSDIDGIGRYLVNYYIGINIETVVLVLLDSKNKLIEVVKVHEGSVNSAAITMRKLVEIPLFKHAVKVVLAHNHPSGTPNPSRADVDLTYRIRRLFQMMEIEFLGHIVVAGDQYEQVGDSAKVEMLQ